MEREGRRVYISTVRTVSWAFAMGQDMAMSGWCVMHIIVNKQHYCCNNTSPYYYNFHIIKVKGFIIMVACCKVCVFGAKWYSHV